MVMTTQTETKRVAILIEQGVEDAEFQIPYNALKKAGANVVVLGSRINEEYKGKQNKVAVKADATTTEAIAADFDAVIIPGGQAPDKMRTNMNTVNFVKEALDAGILVASVCHGPQVLIEGDMLENVRATGFRAIRKDMQNAGAVFVDEPLVIDDNLITSRRPGDLPIFTTAILQYLNLSVPDTSLPNVADADAGWWKLGEEWGGSSKSEIVQAINTAIAGERYSLEAFQHYVDNAPDEAMRELFQEICAHKQQHIQLLESRLNVLGDKPSLAASISNFYADVKAFFQNNRSNIDILRRALGDMQTGVVDIYALRNKLTDPATVDIFDQMEIVLARDEARIAEMYKDRLGDRAPQSPQPSSSPSVTAG
ncbi:MAG: DJ-1/PfpI/YhbO family deglycase/protease [Myxacorys californica WJT36-NPBG1]|jgi:protease I|nr:DJ-1/PfpI/YhbO family deglycase/protease [Myxacorys californica WJT36-NPBG1]